MMASRRIALLAVVGLALGGLILAAATLQTGPGHVVIADTQQYESLPVLFDIPPFTLTDAKGNDFSGESLRGQVYVADFIFTGCPGLCPIMADAMKALQDDFADQPNVQFVSFSVDPESDTPEVLTAYGERYGADPNRWHFLTGDIEVTMHVSVEGFKMGDEESPLDHSSKFALVDQRGRVRGYYDSLDEDDLQQLRRHIRRLL